MWRIVTVSLASVLAFTGLAACGGDDSGDNGPPAGSGTKVTVKMTDYHLELSQQTFSPGVYTFTATNDGQTDHAIEIEGGGDEKKTKHVEPGKSADLTIELKTGQYEMYCPVDGHKGKGMETKITVG
jgi:uncharacterized cupredoxin-like copper-binding protein